MTASASKQVTKLAGKSLYKKIRAEIIALKFAPGQLLSENELAQKYNASRTPIRDALKLLEREGLIVVSARRRTMVAPLDLDAYRQAVFARDIIETAAAGEAARLCESNSEIRLSENVRAQRDAISNEGIAAFDALDMEFHKIVLRIASLDNFGQMIDGLRGQTDRMRVAHLAMLARHDRSGVIDQHEVIAQAIETGNQAVARREMSKHVLSVFHRVVLLAGTHPDIFDGEVESNLERLQSFAAVKSKEYNQ